MLAARVPVPCSRARLRPMQRDDRRGGQFLDIWTRLQRERIMYIGQDLDDEYANQMVAVLLCLAQEDNTKGVQMYQRNGALRLRVEPVENLGSAMAVLRKLSGTAAPVKAPSAASEM